LHLDPRRPGQPPPGRGRIRAVVHRRSAAADARDPASSTGLASAHHLPGRPARPRNSRRRSAPASGAATHAAP
jgi:hypothetical protein